MKKVLDLIFSSRSTVIFLFLLAIAMGTATFIEDKYDTETARQLVYNAKWFEFLFLLLVLNFIGGIKKYGLLSRKKLTGFLFHFAFIVIIIGAGITRYTGFNGTMHIRQGEASNIINSSDAYLRILGADNTGQYNYDIPVHLSQLTGTSFSQHIDSKEKGPIDIEYTGVIKNAKDTVQENVTGANDIIEIVVAGDNGRESFYINHGQVMDFGKYSISFNDVNKGDIKIFEKDGIPYINSAFLIKRTKMPEMGIDSVFKDSTTEFRAKSLYEFQGGLFVFKKLYKNAKKILVAGKAGERGPDALLLNIKYAGKNKEVQIIGGSDYMANYQDFNLDGFKLRMGYGVKEIELPFSLYLNKFNLERYPGSMSPSSFTSDVTLIDKRNGINEKHSIFMNNVLDYDGYRFFQSSYDPDENGTILSVNHDFYGTWVSYFGYFLLALGFFLALFNKNSRFHALAQKIRKIRHARKAVMSALVLVCISSMAYSQTVNHVSVQHADKLGHVIVQTFDGRFEPLNTLAYDVIHKISKKDEFDVEGVGKMNDMQVFIDMLMNVDFWKRQKMIYIREKSVKDLLGIDGSCAAFNDFFDEKANYKLKDVAEVSFRKKQSDQNNFDKEIIKIDERANICMMVFNGSMLRLFPDKNAVNNAWISWDDSLAYIPLSGSIRALNEELQLKEFNVKNIFAYYLQEVYKGTMSGDYTKADKILAYITSIQQQSPAVKFLPSESRINSEIHYNTANIFGKLRNWYGMLSVILLIVSLIDTIRVKKNKAIKVILNVCIVLLVCAFTYHTYGMILRWYLTGHAPWSTGYEALLLIGWGGVLAGFFFVRNSKITLAATTLLAFFVLMTASHSNYDPQLTNLQPVLKSYWLIIHVATLTISYGFLGLAFLLGLINMFIYVFKTQKNHARLDLVTTELSSINEMNITIGLFLATVGTFLGGIWANESWGKYWGWDAKETWALVIVITYTIVLHLRFASKLRGEYIFNMGSVLAYASVLMTFFGVNYYLSKGMHSYAAGDTPVFPVWAWISIVSIILLLVIAGIKDKKIKREAQK